MNTEHLHRPLSSQEHAALIDAAKLRAMELRREAIHDFWSTFARTVRRSWYRATRESAQARRLRHQP